MSYDLIWECTRNQSSWIVKRPHEKPFSREALNLTNQHAYRYSGLANDKAIGLIPAPGGKGIQFMTKNNSSKSKQNPSKNVRSVVIKNTSSKAVATNVYNATTKKGYRADLRYEALARASAIILAQQPKNGKVFAKKVRGSKK